MLQTKLWTDGFVQELTTEEKLLFIYFLTNPHTEMCGIYEVSLKTIEFETGIKKDRILKAIDSLSKARKVFYIDGFIVVKNFMKHQQMNPKVTVGIQRSLNLLPEGLRQKLGLEEGQNDSLYIDYDSLSHFNSNFNLNSNSNLKIKKTPSKKVSDKVAYGEEAVVKMTEAEHHRLCQKYGRANVASSIVDLELYILQHGKKYKSHYATVGNWIRRDIKSNKLRIKSSDFRRSDFDTEEDYENKTNQY